MRLFPYRLAQRIGNNLWTIKVDKHLVLLDLFERRSAAARVEFQLLTYLLDRHPLYAFEAQDDCQETASVKPVYTLRLLIMVNKSNLLEIVLSSLSVP